MKRRIATVFCAAVALCAARGPGGAAPPGEAYRQAAALGGDGTAAAVAENPESASALAGLGMDGGGLRRGSVVVDPSGRTVKDSAGLSAESPSPAAAKKEPPSPEGAPADKKPFLPKWAVYGGAALLGGLSGFFSGGPLGAVAGALGGLASAHFFQKGDYGASFGITAGMIVGAAVAGPIGGLIGALIGGLVGHFVGKLIG